MNTVYELWDQMLKTRDNDLRLQLVRHSQKFVRASLEIADEYARELPSPNKLVAALGDVEYAHELIKRANNASMAVFAMMERMREMDDVCTAMGAELEQSVERTFLKASKKALRKTIRKGGTHGAKVPSGVLALAMVLEKLGYSFT